MITEPEKIQTLREALISSCHGELGRKAELLHMGLLCIMWVSDILQLNFDVFNQIRLRAMNCFSFCDIRALPGFCQSKLKGLLWNRG